MTTLGRAICFGNSKVPKFNGQMRSASVQARRKFNKLAAAKLNHQPRPFGECLISRIAIDMIVIGNQSARTRLAVIALNVNEKLFRFSAQHRMGWNEAIHVLEMHRNACESDAK